MRNEGKSEQLRVLVSRVNQNVKDIENLNMADFPPWWPTLEAKAKAINDDLRILLPLAAEIHPALTKAVTTMKEAVVNMRIDSYNRMNDVTAGYHQKVEVCEAMKAHGITDQNSQRGIDFCTQECPYHVRCIAIEPGG